jgi:hypothetical protein
LYPNWPKSGKNVLPEFHMDTQVLGTSRLADEIDGSTPERRNVFTKALFFAGKLIVSAACFWYALRQIDVSEAVRTLPNFDFRWAAFAVTVIMVQILLLALRLWAVVHALTPNAARLTYPATCALSAIYALLAQVLPSVVGEGIRGWMLTRFGCGWRAGLTSVMIDRAVGVASPSSFCCCRRRSRRFPATAISCFSCSARRSSSARWRSSPRHASPRCCSAGGIPTGSARLRLTRTAFCSDHARRSSSAPRP